MPAKLITGAADPSAIEDSLPRRYFVTRGEIQRAFGFSRQEVSDLISQGVFAAEYPLGRRRTVQRGGEERTVASRAKFVRRRVIEVARTWAGRA